MINIDRFLLLEELWKNCTLNAAYHDYGYTAEQIEELDTLWRAYHVDQNKEQYERTSITFATSSRKRL